MSKAIALSLDQVGRSKDETSELLGMLILRDNDFLGDEAAFGDFLEQCLRAQLLGRTSELFSWLYGGLEGTFNRLDESLDDEHLAVGTRLYDLMVDLGTVISKRFLCDWPERHLPKLHSRCLSGSDKTSETFHWDTRECDVEASDVEAWLHSSDGTVSLMSVEINNHSNEDSGLNEGVEHCYVCVGAGDRSDPVLVSIAFMLDTIIKVDPYAAPAMTMTRRIAELARSVFGTLNMVDRDAAIAWLGQAPARMLSNRPIVPPPDFFNTVVSCTLIPLAPPASPLGGIQETGSALFPIGGFS